MSGCHSEKMARVYLELVTPALPMLRDGGGQEDLKRLGLVQSLECAWNFILAFPTERDLFNTD